MRPVILMTAARWGLLGGVLVAGFGAARSSPPVQAASRVGGHELEWIQVPPDQPWIVYEGGTASNQCTPANGCASWAMRSQDGGRTWIDLGPAWHLKLEHGGPVISINSLAMTPDGRHAYVALHSSQPDSPDHSCSAVLTSFDAGRRWSTFDPAGDSCADGAGPTEVVISPADPSRVYEKDVNPSGALLDVSRDGGRSVDQSNPFPSDTLGASSGDLFPDPAARDAIYIYSYDTDDQGRPTKAQLQWSADSGGHWSKVRTPLDGGSFQPVLDPHELGLLEVRPSQSRRFTDRIYLSGDHGRSWRAATCPGDWHGRCPAFTLDNVFGAGHAYAFVNDGIYSFDGTGPARSRLPISSHLPFAMPELLDVQGGTRQGAPIYVLGRAAVALRTRLYRSTDGGRSWQRVS